MAQEWGEYRVQFGDRSEKNRLRNHLKPCDMFLKHKFSVFDHNFGIWVSQELLDFQVMVRQN